VKVAVNRLDPKTEPQICFSESHVVAMLLQSASPR
jgi:hypothetical protein